MVLVAVEISHQDDAGLVEPGGRAEDVARQRHGGFEDVVEFLGPVAGERFQGGRGGRRDGVEDAQKRIRIAFVVAGDELGEIEVVAGVHANAVFSSCGNRGPMTRQEPERVVADR